MCRLGPVFEIVICGATYTVAFVEPDKVLQKAEGLTSPPAGGMLAVSTAGQELVLSISKPDILLSCVGCIRVKNTILKMV